MRSGWPLTMGSFNPARSATSVKRAWKGSPAGFLRGLGGTPREAIPWPLVALSWPYKLATGHASRLKKRRRSKRATPLIDEPSGASSSDRGQDKANSPSVVEAKEPVAKLPKDLETEFDLTATYVFGGALSTKSAARGTLVAGLSERGRVNVRVGVPAIEIVERIVSRHFELASKSLQDVELLCYAGIQIPEAGTGQARELQRILAQHVCIRRYRLEGGYVEPAMGSGI